MLWLTIYQEEHNCTFERINPTSFEKSKYLGIKKKDFTCGIFYFLTLYTKSIGSIVETTKLLSRLYNIIVKSGMKLHANGIYLLFLVQQLVLILA